MSFRFKLHLTADKTKLNARMSNGQVKVENGKHVCMKCNKEFKRKKHWTRHMDLHAGRFKFYCDDCKKGFRDSTDYKKHMNIHTGILYRCTVCTKTFTTEEGRNKHMSVHTGIYRFNCNQCGKGFNDKIQYNKHTMQPPCNTDSNLQNA